MRQQASVCRFGCHPIHWIHRILSIQNQFSPAVEYSYMNPVAIFNGMFNHPGVINAVAVRTKAGIYLNLAGDHHVYHVRFNTSVCGGAEYGVEMFSAGVTTTASAVGSLSPSQAPTGNFQIRVWRPWCMFPLRAGTAQYQYSPGSRRIINIHADAFKSTDYHRITVTHPFW